MIQFLLLLNFILPIALITAVPNKPSGAEIYIHEDISVQVKQAPLCETLQVMSTGWTKLTSSGATSGGTYDVGKTQFDTICSSSRILHRACKTCGATHKDIYYKRLTTYPSSTSIYDLIHTTWSSTGNILGTDFNLYSTHKDALADTNPWLTCNYDDPGVGFPRDCGPTSGVGGQWQSSTRSGQSDWAWFVDIPSNYGVDMRACFDPSGFNKAPNYQKWKATVGAFTGVPSGDDRPYLSKDAEGIYSAKMNQPFVKGSTLSKMSFGTIKGSGTFCSKTRYTGATKGRILNGDGNWLHGHWNGRAGIAHYDGWVGSASNAVDPVDNWVVFCCSRYGVNRYVNGVKKNDNQNRNGDTKNVFINTGGCCGGETSDWGGKSSFSFPFLIYELNINNFFSIFLLPFAFFTIISCIHCFMESRSNT